MASTIGAAGVVGTDLARAQDDGAGSATIRVVEANRNVPTSFGSLMGGHTEGTIGVVIENTTESVIEDVQVVVEVNGRSTATEVDLVAFGPTDVSVPIAFERGEWGPQEIAVSVNGTAEQMTHWNMPWVFIGLFAAMVNMVLLGIRNLLRNRVRKQLVAERRATELSGGAAPSTGLMPAMLAVSDIPACNPQGSQSLPLQEKSPERAKCFWEDW